MTMDAYREWESNAKVYLFNESISDTFLDDVRASLPETHRSSMTVFVGFSRGGFLLSAYVEKHVSEARAIVFIASPGDLFDYTSRGKTISFVHELDPVPRLGKVRAHIRHTFRGTSVDTGKRRNLISKVMNEARSIATIHTSVYRDWFAELHTKMKGRMPMLHLELLRGPAF